jgi:choline dehydrogenase
MRRRIKGCSACRRLRSAPMSAPAPARCAGCRDLLDPVPGWHNFQLAADSGVTAIMNILRSESTGSIHITSKSPQTPPAVRFNFLTAQLDREVTLEAMRITRRIMAASPMRHIATDEIAPGVNIKSDDELLDWVRKNAETTYHPVGTCKMGHDPMAVVDDQLRVHGMQGLRVADASIMPTLTSGNTNAPSIMIGEKAARMVLAGAAA